MPRLKTRSVPKNNPALTATVRRSRFTRYLPPNIRRCSPTFERAKAACRSMNKIPVGAAGRRTAVLHQFLTRQALESFHVFRARLFNDLRRQMRRGRGLVPIESLQVIADELFVEARRALTNHILIF